MSFRHLAYVPFTGLGLYGGFRGNRWLRNRISVFKQFVIPALENQTAEFTLWVSWRPEERNNKHVKELERWLSENTEIPFVFTYSGLCFWDDKYDDDTAYDRLVTALHGTSGELADAIGDVDEVYMTIQPSDDIYAGSAYEAVQKIFEKTDLQSVGFTLGYIMNYRTKELCEYNPKTNPPFFTYRMSKATFLDPFLHCKTTGPYKSHEYIGQHMKYLPIPERMFLVGTHGENVSTHFNHPYAGRQIEGEEKLLVTDKFGISDVPAVTIPLSIRKLIMRKLPHQWQRKLRYIFGEKFAAKIYSFLRN